MRINLRRAGLAKDWRRLIYAELVKQLLDEYDLEDYNTKEWIKSAQGQPIFIKWLTEKGYKVKAYTWPDDKSPRSAGLEFDDNDPLLIALKLRHCGNDNE